MSKPRQWLIERSGDLFAEQLASVGFPAHGPVTYSFEPAAQRPLTFATESQAYAQHERLPPELRAVCRVVERA